MTSKNTEDCKDCIWDEIFDPRCCRCSRSPTNYLGQKFGDEFEARPKEVGN